MTDELTDEQLAEWERLEAAATDGPWDADGNGIHHGHECVGLTYHEDRKANAAFIAAARSAVPVLVRALRDARDENEQLRQKLGAAAKTLTWLPSQYTVAEENALRVVSLLHSDCYRLGAELAALAAPTGQETE